MEICEELAGGDFDSELLKVTKGRSSENEIKSEKASDKMRGQRHVKILTVQKLDFFIVLRIVISVPAAFSSCVGNYGDKVFTC